jgi:hypothetical protein
MSLASKCLGRIVVRPTRMRSTDLGIARSSQGLQEPVCISALQAMRRSLQPRETLVDRTLDLVSTCPAVLPGSLRLSVLRGPIATGSIPLSRIYGISHRSTAQRFHSARLRVIPRAIRTELADKSPLSPFASATNLNLRLGYVVHS